MHWISARFMKWTLYKLIPEGRYSFLIIFFLENHSAKIFIRFIQAVRGLVTSKSSNICMYCVKSACNFCVFFFYIKSSCCFYLCSMSIHWPSLHVNWLSEHVVNLIFFSVDSPSLEHRSLSTPLIYIYISGGFKS